MNPFEVCLLEHMVASNNLHRYLKNAVDVFAINMRQFLGTRSITVWDASGKTYILPLGLTLSGFRVVTDCEEGRLGAIAGIAQQVDLEAINWKKLKPEETVDSVIIADDAISEYLTESALQARLSQVAAALKPQGILLISVAQYDQLLQNKPRFEEPQVLFNRDGHCIDFLLREWGGTPFTYTAYRYWIHHSDETHVVQHAVSSHRAWRRAELHIALSRAGFADIQWTFSRNNDWLVTARRILVTEV